jgi:hypothetical protein|nr:MAG TPA: hypothetical protein [Bacteriophage sp.]
MKAKVIYVIVLVLMGLSIYGLLRKVSSLNEELNTSYANIKAYDSELSNQKNSNRVFQLTIEQLEYFNDSVLNEMNEVRKELGIKDKQLQSMGYVLSTMQRKDTITMNDTIFVRELNVDTIIGDRWYSAELGLRYPNKIILNPKFVSEKYIIGSLRKETVKPPKKFFLLRWFQKKQKVMEVEVVEKSPYSEKNKEKFIQIIK